MKYVVMTKTETVATDKGPMVLPKDGKPKLVEDWIAASLMGRGYAFETDADGNPVAEIVVTSSDPELPAPVDLDTLNIVELREIAARRNIPDYKKLKKADLLAALKASLAGPPPTPFEKISMTGDKQAPEFKAE